MLIRKRSIDIELNDVSWWLFPTSKINEAHGTIYGLWCQQSSLLHPTPSNFSRYSKHHCPRLPFLLNQDLPIAKNIYFTHRFPCTQQQRLLSHTRNLWILSSHKGQRGEKFTSQLRIWLLVGMQSLHNLQRKHLTLCGTHKCHMPLQIPSTWRWEVA